MARKRKKKLIATEANNVSEGMEVHAQFGGAYYNGTVTRVEGEYFWADWHDGTNEKCSCDPNLWTAGHLSIEPEEREKKKQKKAGAKKTAAEASGKKKAAAPKTKKLTKKQQAAAD